jgi:hypothetical protein
MSRFDEIAHIVYLISRKAAIELSHGGTATQSFSRGRGVSVVSVLLMLAFTVFGTDRNATDEKPCCHEN